MSHERSARNVQPDSSDFDPDALMERDKLQRQIRITKGAFDATRIHSQDLIRKQCLEIQKLSEEDEELQKNLHVSNNQTRRQSDSLYAQQHRALLDQCDDLDKHAQSERLSQVESEQEIQSIQKNLEKLNQNVSFHSQKSPTSHTQKATLTRENNLERTVIHFNKQMAKNNQLRKEVVKLYEKRVQFQELYHKLYKALQKIRQKTGDIVGVATAAYDARMEIQTKMIMKTEKAMKDLADYRAEIKELERLIAHEQCLRDFMDTKCRKRTELNLSGRHELMEEWRTNSALAVENLEKVFRWLHKMTGEGNLEMLVGRFIQAEHRNFSLLSYVNEQNMLAEDFKVQIREIEEEMEKYQVKNVQQEQEQQTNLQQTEEEHSAESAQAMECEAQAKEITQVLNQTESELSVVFNETDCDRAAMDSLLGSSAGNITSNIMTYLRLVEQKTNELLTVQAFINSKAQEEEEEEEEEEDYDPALHGQIAWVQRQAPSSCDDIEKEELLLPHKDVQPSTREEGLVN